MFTSATYVPAAPTNSKTRNVFVSPVIIIDSRYMLQGNTYSTSTSPAFTAFYIPTNLVHVTLLHYHFIFLERSRRYYNADYYSNRLSTYMVGKSIINGLQNAIL